MKTTLPTQHAPAERATLETLRKQARLLANADMVTQLLDTVNDVVLILNPERQIVYTNRALFEVLSCGRQERILGKRPGELLGCIHACQSEGGCGTTEFCRMCGAVNAILEAQQDVQSAKECRILKEDGSSLELTVRATPHMVEGELYTVFAMTDISHEKRRQALERTFFHDVLNTAGGIKGLSSIMQDEQDSAEAGKFAEMLHRSSNRLIEEITTQRQLLEAESGALPLDPQSMNSLDMVSSAVESCRDHDVAENRAIVVDADADAAAITTDGALAGRVLVNMVKNALEATDPGGIVTVSCRAKGDSVEFLVANPTFMPRDVQLQVFKRSFTTKGTGRGTGTYSMKLLAERYLGGTIAFSSSEQDGTEFMLTLPVSLATL